MVIHCSGYFVYATASIQELVIVIGVIGPAPIKKEHCVNSKVSYNRNLH